MKYLLKIRKTHNEHPYELSVPDMPGCSVNAHSIDEAMNTIEAVIADHLKILAEYGETIPQASSIDAMMNSNTDREIIWAVIDIDILPYMGKSHKINVTLPELLIKQIDDRVSKSEKYKTRSGFIAIACSILLQKG